MREGPRIRPRTKESVDARLEAEIDKEAMELQSDAAELETNMADVDEKAVPNSVLIRIEGKYRNLVGNLNLLAGISAALTVGNLLKDIVNPADFTMYQSIDWNDIGSRGVQGAAIIAGVYAIARIGAWLRKKYQESNAEKRSNLDSTD